MIDQINNFVDLDQSSVSEHSASEPIEQRSEYWTC